ncbi:MAG: MarR family winged helix-turn-helix transcriptional regulator [Planctomycetota bacterium]
MQDEQPTKAVQAEQMTEPIATNGARAEVAEGATDGDGANETVARAREAAHAMARQCLGSRARILSRSITRIFDERFRAFDVTGAQLYLLGAIGYFGAKSPSELARALSMDKSTLSRNLQRLVDRRLVAIDSSGRGRGQSVDLTEEGGELLLRIQPAWTEAQAQVRELLGVEDAGLLIQLGNRLWQLEQGG